MLVSLGAKCEVRWRKSIRYDEARILKRSQVISLAINARKQRFPHEESFCYQPLASCADDHRWDENTLTKLKDYNLLDLSI